MWTLYHEWIPWCCIRNMFIYFIAITRVLTWHCSSVHYQNFELRVFIYAEEIWSSPPPSPNPQWNLWYLYNVILCELFNFKHFSYVKIHNMWTTDLEVIWWRLWIFHVKIENANFSVKVDDILVIHRYITIEMYIIYRV